MGLGWSRNRSRIQDFYWLSGLSRTLEGQSLSASTGRGPQGRLEAWLLQETAHHLIGCSLQAMIECTRRRWGWRTAPEAYWLHHVEFENAVLVHPDAARALNGRRVEAWHSLP